ncbi:putative glycerophosphodiester phosphodiesterase, protein kinase RLK-Pelle-LRK10L-2 family [Helianthus annuus]|uniref:Glycerophosphodiester phosphodiesterase, protein kinase RLK-Pelle-LRK10L-2 family n=1 Tax=Helianthus annuus TaxID=4232 RepID=A0A251V2H8_HELAN|nr:LEAF RUST 10 DISEASE-RESISTANCE LOCUS RECEPTOR-LIKE PROTEIN KINASE-like 2.5 isoform X1 [Helianthus annuus]KAF5812137.1 putative glycerophosphodiester phosphodiesterase, protein kinase RLK-Pelle-LRK10L-2 family [Helianthus annuus]KAJ0591038.1 putative glycerophosphodiester phosphodiesterase, protein kinase RLK-Pelle-LRK10L-2 family [Helianthus annuus]KAJ0928898.1 putative glycerophosphodiester phosphodiesterase, protein kinase RLK-Pelle-LRK10L-2 family [Helianthus annuus]KAJ0933259.1 putative
MIGNIIVIYNMIRNLDSTLLILFLLFHRLQHLSSQDVGTNSSQPICPTSFSCSNLGPVSFPFYASGNSACGLCEVDCNQLVPKIRLTQDYPSYDLVRVMPGSTSSPFVFVRDNYFSNQITNKSCDSLTYRFPPNSSSLSYNISPTLSVLRCVKTLGLVDSYFRAVGEYYVFDKCDDYNYYYTYSNGYISSNTNLPLSCSVVVLPGNSPYTLPKETDFNDLFQLLTSELNLVVQVSDRCQECHRRGGQCSNKNQEFWCKYSTRNTKKENPRNTVIKSALASLAIGTAIILILLVLCYRFKIFSKRDAENYSNLEAIIKTHESLAPKRYSYSHVKKMTDSFKVKVGEGGYGSVYRGKLQNGNDVAVKVLNELKGNGEDLVNELASISKTCHVNIVSLVGFCFERRHKALIYEYMPNGSLEKYIYNPSTTTGSQLEWKKLYDIAVGIGRGLEYLHRGCNTRILHFDIKPHNILLDKDLCPKISDFGLAKLCPETRSVVSMSGMRGTPGYIAPEVFSRNFGVVSHKSDVYSYGMMVLEMVRGRRNVVVEDDDTSNMYFFDSVYKQVVSNKNLVLSGVLDVQDKEVAKKMILVGLWCTQSDPSSRPSISKVLDMLEGDLKSIQIPPKPFMYSTSRSPDSRH